MIDIEMNSNKFESENLDDVATTLLAVNSTGKSQAGVLTFKEALDMTNFGKFNIFLIFISGIVLAHALLETATIGFVLPIAQCDLELSNQDKGLLSAIGFVGIIISAHLWGFLADTTGRRKVILPTLLLSFLMTILSSFSNRFWVMLVFRFANGFCVSGGSATIYAYLGEFHTDKARPRAMMGSAFIFALGAMLVPFIVALTLGQEWVLPMPWLGVDYKPWRLFIIICGLPGFLAGLLMILLPESPKFLLSMGKLNEAKEALQQMYRWNGGKGDLKLGDIISEEDAGSTIHIQSSSDDSNFVVAFLNTMWNQTVPLFKRKYLRITFIVCTVQFWLYVATNGLYMWFPHIINSMVEFMSKHPGEQKRICEIVYEKNDIIYKEDGTMECTSKLEDSTYLYSLLMEILYASSFAFIGLIINYVGQITLLFVSIIFFTSCGLAAVFIPDPSIASYLYVLLFLVGVAINILGAATVDLYPTQLRAMAICISLMIGRLGSVVGANIVGALLANYCELTFYITVGALYVCAFLTLLIPAKKT